MSITRRRDFLSWKPLRTCWYQLSTKTIWIMKAWGCMLCLKIWRKHPNSFKIWVTNKIHQKELVEGLFKLSQEAGCSQQERTILNLISLLCLEWQTPWDNVSYWQLTDIEGAEKIMRIQKKVDRIAHVKAKLEQDR